MPAHHALILTLLAVLATTALDRIAYADIEIRAEALAAKAEATLAQAEALRAEARAACGGAP